MVCTHENWILVGVVSVSSVELKSAGVPPQAVNSNNATRIPAKYLCVTYFSLEVTLMICNFCRVLSSTFTPQCYFSKCSTNLPYIEHLTITKGMQKSKKTLAIGVFFLILLTHQSRKLYILPKYPMTNYKLPTKRTVTNIESFDGLNLVFNVEWERKEWERFDFNGMEEIIDYMKSFYKLSSKALSQLESY